MLLLSGVLFQRLLVWAMIDFHHFVWFVVAGANFQHSCPHWVVLVRLDDPSFELVGHLYQQCVEHAWQII